MIYTHLAAALVAAAVGAAGAWQVQGWRWRAADADRLELERENKLGQQIRADGAAVRHETERATIRAQQQIITREIERVVQVPLYRSECVDADGLRLIAQAIGPAASAGQPAAAVPASAAAP